MDTVSALRTANFVAGGTAHVLMLGIFAVLASRIPGMSKPIKVLGYVAATPAVLSLVSLVCQTVPVDRPESTVRMC